jgi:hypothetical protein
MENRNLTTAYTRPATRRISSAFTRGRRAGDAERSAARVFEIPDGDMRLATARGSVSFRRMSFSEGPRFGLSSAGRGGRCGLRVSWVSEMRIVSTAPPNKPMHPTADTRAVINSGEAGRRVIGSVRLLVIFKTLTQTCGWQRRAALFPFGAADFGGGPRFIFSVAGRGGRCVASG